MSLDSNIFSKIKNLVISKGYTKIDRGLVVFGGKDNGTVDLMASKPDNTKAVVLEIKDNPLNLIDVSQFLLLIKNIKSKLKVKNINFYLLTTDREISKSLIDLSNKLNIKTENTETFCKRNKI